MKKNLQQYAAEVEPYYKAMVNGEWLAVFSFPINHSFGWPPFDALRLLRTAIIN